MEDVLNHDLSPAKLASDFKFPANIPELPPLHLTHGVTADDTFRRAGNVFACDEEGHGMYSLEFCRVLNAMAFVAGVVSAGVGVSANMEAVVTRGMFLCGLSFLAFFIDSLFSHLLRSPAPAEGPGGQRQP